MDPSDGFEFVECPDLSQISDLICRTWARPCWNYDTGLLQLHINRPTGDASLAIGQRSESGVMASFQAYMPFRVSYFGNQYNAVFASFLTVSGDFQGKGLAGTQQGALIEKAIEKGYDLYITMCEVGAGSNIAVEKTFGKKGIPVKVVNVLNYIASPQAVVGPALPDSPSGKTRTYQTDDKSSIGDLIRKTGANTSLHKVIPEEDFDFLFSRRPHCKSYVYEKDGRIAGLINLLLLEVLDVDDTRLNVYFDNVAFGDLNEDEQAEFVGDVMLDIQSEKYHTAFMPDIGYVSNGPFTKFRFRTAPRQVNLYIAPLKQGLLADGIKEVESFYMDVY